MSGIHNSLSVVGLSLAVALTIAWDGLVAYGLIALIRGLRQLEAIASAGTFHFCNEGP
jgi:hypothetical protein